MGTSVRLLAQPGRAARTTRRALIEDLEARLTRFDPDSELCRAERRPARGRAGFARRCATPSRPRSRAPRPPAGSPTRRCSAPWCVRATRGRSSATRAPTCARRSPPRRPRARRAAPAADWRRVRVDDAAGTVVRPPGVRARPRRQRQGPRGRPRRRRCSPRTARAPPTSAATCACAARTRCWSSPGDRHARRACSSSTTTPSPRRASTSASGGTPAAARRTTCSTPRPAARLDRRADRDRPRADAPRSPRRSRRPAILAGPDHGRDDPGAPRRPPDHERRRRAERARGDPWRRLRVEVRGMRDPMDYGWWLASRASASSRSS